MGRKALIVGATSTVGRHVVAQLTSAGRVEPVAAVRTQSQADGFAEQGISTVGLDLASAAS